MKKLPKFKTEEEEIEFWETHDALEYSEETDELISGGPKTQTLNIRIESQVKSKIEEYASLNRMDVSDMLRSWIYECLEREIRLRYPDDQESLSSKAALSVLLQGQKEILEAINNQTKQGQSSKEITLSQQGFSSNASLGSTHSGLTEVIHQAKHAAKSTQIVVELLEEMTNVPVKQDSEIFDTSTSNKAGSLTQ